MGETFRTERLSDIVDIIDDHKITSIICHGKQFDLVKYGHWEIVDEAEPRRYGCSVCKKLSWTEDNYCSYCGSKMREIEK